MFDFESGFDRLSEGIWQPVLGVGENRMEGWMGTLEQGTDLFPLLRSPGSKNV